MLQMWKEKGLNLHLTRYRVLNLGDEYGMIQVVRDALTACKIQKVDKFLHSLLEVKRNVLCFPNLLYCHDIGTSRCHYRCSQTNNTC
jgi:hypothetical protein